MNRVIRGMKNTISNMDRKPLIFMEIGWGINHPHWDEELTEFEWLFSIGYKRLDFSGMVETSDVLFIPDWLDNKIVY
jgi:hypothetical protein